MLRLLFLLNAAFALAQVRTVNTLPEPPVAIATDAMGFVYVAANAFSANHPAIDHFRGSAVLSSSDLGATWTPAGNFPEDTVKGIAADPVNPGTLLVTGTNGIWKTKDTGAHWYRVLSYPAPSSISPGDIAYDPAVPGHVLTVGYDSTDGGESWIAFTVLAPTHWGPFAFEPKGNGIVFEGGGAGYRSVDGGRTWAALPAQEPWRSFAFDPQRRGVVYGLGYTLSGVYVSTDYGATFLAKAVPFQNPTYPQYQDGVADLYADPGHPGRVYATTESGILYRSDDAATSWQKVYSGAGQYRSHVVRTCSALVFGNDNWTNLTRSLDDGNTWQAVGAGPAFLFTCGMQALRLAGLLTEWLCREVHSRRGQARVGHLRQRRLAIDLRYQPGGRG